MLMMPFGVHMFMYTQQVLQFKSDTLDQSSRLAKTVFDKFGRDGQLQYSRLDGSHVTPNTPDLRYKL
jgi:hypothetical protein